MVQIYELSLYKDLKNEKQINQKTERLVREVVAESSVDAVIEKVTDIMRIAAYEVFGTQAVVVDGEVKSVGKIPGKEDIKAWITK